MPTWVTPKTYIAGEILRSADMNVNVRDNLQVLRVQALALETDVNSVRGRIVELEDADGSHGTRLDQLEASDVLQRDRLDALEAEDVPIGERLSSIEEEDSDQTDDINAVSPRLAAVEGSRGRVQGDINTLQTQVSTLMQGDSGPAPTNAQITARIVTLEGQLGPLQISIGGYSTRVSTAEGSLTTLRDRVSPVESNIDTLQGQVMTLMNAPDDPDVDPVLVGRVSGAEDDIDTLQINVNGLTLRMGTAEGNVSTLEGQVQTLQANPPGDSGLGLRVTMVEGELGDLQTLVGARTFGSNNVWEEISSQNGVSTLQGIRGWPTRFITSADIANVLSSLTAEANDFIEDHVDDINSVRRFYNDLDAVFHSSYVAKLNEIITSYNGAVGGADVPALPASTIPDQP